MNSEEREKFRRGIGHFNRGEFFICHEALEEIWLTAPLEEKPFYQGLIQVAAAFHHLSRGNRTGAASLLAAGLAKLEAYPEGKNGLALEALRMDLRACVAGLREQQESESPGTSPPKIRWAEAETP